MKRLLFALMLVALSSSAHAEGGTPTNPLYVREQQGTTRTYAEVNCTTAGDIALVATTATANARSIVFFNEDATNFVTICPVTAAAGVCDAVGEGLRVSWRRMPMTWRTRLGPRPTPKRRRSKMAWSRLGASAVCKLTQGSVSRW
jgi:hypothetical protein